MKNTDTRKPTCKLIGEDGNVFNIIGLVCKCLKKNNMADKAGEFRERAFASSNYDEVLRLCMDYVEIR